MATEQNNLDRLKGKNPFSVPDGYMEGLADHIMSQLPEKTPHEAVRISMMERVRPWLYLTAVFAGLGLFFKVFLAPDGVKGTGGDSEALIVKTEVPVESVSAMQAEEDEEYLEYLEAKYAGNLLAEEMTNSEEIK